MFSSIALYYIRVKLCAGIGMEKLHRGRNGVKCPVIKGTLVYLLNG
jgi:hypothetical protein